MRCAMLSVSYPRIVTLKRHKMYCVDAPERYLSVSYPRIVTLKRTPDIPTMPLLAAGFQYPTLGS